MEVLKREREMGGDVGRVGVDRARGRRCGRESERRGDERDLSGNVESAASLVENASASAEEGKGARRAREERQRTLTLWL